MAAEVGQADGFPRKRGTEFSEVPATAMTVPRDELGDLHHVVALCSELSSLATTDSDLQQVVSTVAQRAGVWAAVVDGSLSVLAQWASPAGEQRYAGVLDGDPDAVSQLIEAAARMRRAVSLPAWGASAVSLVVAPILVGDDSVAYLMTAGYDAEETGEDFRIMVTEHAAMVSAVILGRRRVVAIAAGRARQELFDGLVLVSDRTEADIQTWARHLGIEPDERQRVLVAEPHSDARIPGPAVTDLVEQMITTRCPAAIVVNRATEIVALVPGDDDARLTRRLAELARLCCRSVIARFPGVRLTAGLSDPHTGAVDIGKSYAEARHAADVGRLMPGLPDVTVFAELGVHRLLAEVRDPSRLEGFARGVLGELIDYDRANGTRYCATLTAYYRQNSSLQRAAALLHTHPNTVAYRVRRAGEIIRLDLGSYADRLAVQVALEIVNGLGGSTCAISS
jgi:sugar diacid utilization regulator